MNARRGLCIVTAVCAALWLAGPPVHAGDSSAPVVAEDYFETAFLSLGATPSSDAVLRISRKAQFGEPLPALRLAGAMSSLGGHACAAGLRTLVRHRDPDVRAAALRGVAQLRLRAATDMDVVRAARDDRDPAVRDAAYAAIGVVGDATDVPALLDALASTDSGVVAAAFAALRDLSGARLRCRVVLWRQWWKETEAGAPERLARALTILATSADPAERAEAQAFVERTAWIRLSVVQNRVQDCLKSESPELRRMGYRLAASLRLADLGDALAAAVSIEHDAECLRVASESARALGVAVSSRAVADRR